MSRTNHVNNQQSVVMSPYYNQAPMYDIRQQMLFSDPLMPSMSLYNDPRMLSLGYGMPYVNPLEAMHTKHQLYKHEQGSKGLMIGGLSGAAAGAAAGSIIPGIGTIFGAAIGAIAGAFLAGKGTQIVLEHEAVNRDASDNGLLDGSPLGYGGGH